MIDVSRIAEFITRQETLRKNEYIPKTSNNEHGSVTAMPRSILNFRAQLLTSYFNHTCICMHSAPSQIMSRSFTLGKAVYYFHGFLDRSYNMGETKN